MAPTTMLTALRRLEMLLAAGPDEPAEVSDGTRDAAIAMLVETAGPMPAKAAGALAILAELIVTERQYGVTLDLERWVPMRA